MQTKSITPIAEPESDGALIIQARHAGVEYLPGNRVLYQGQPGVIRLVKVDSSIEFRIDNHGKLFMSKRYDPYYYVTLDNGDHIAQISKYMLQHAPDPADEATRPG